MTTGFNNDPIEIRLLKGTYTHKPLSDIKDFCKGYDWITVHVWWSGLNAYDGIISLVEKISSRVPTTAWCNVPNLSCNITDIDGNGNGAYIFRDVDLHCTEVGLYINKNTATTGQIWYEYSLRKQYGNENVVSGINELKRAIDSLRWVR